MNRRRFADSILRRRRMISAVLVMTGAMAAGAPAANADIRVSPNFPLRPSGDAVYGRDALGLAVNPRNQRNIVAVYADWVSLNCEVASSTDGGQRWRRFRLRVPEGFTQPPCTVGNHLAQQLDGGIAFGSQNSVYVTFATGAVSAEQGAREQGKSVFVAKSTDGGRTFGVGQVVLRGGEDAARGPDYFLPKLAVSQGGTTGRDRVYVTTAASGSVAGRDVVFTTSGDGGQTWAPGSIVDAPADSAIEPTPPALGRGGAVYVGYRTQDPVPNAANQFRPTGTVAVARTVNLGQAWSRTTVAGVSGYIYGGPVVRPFARTGQAFTASTFPWLAANPRTQDVYIVYGNGGTPTVPGTAAAADHFIHPDLDVWFQRSRDGGNTWSLPNRLNENAPIQYEITQTRHPTISVAPNGRVDVVWQDRRHWYRGCPHTHSPCSEARLGDTYLRSSDNEGLSFGAARRITDRSINNDVGFDYRFGAYWDYGPKALPIGNNRLLVGWMDSRDGNSETDNMGLWLANVNLRASNRVPVQRVTRRDSADLALRLSRLTYPAGTEATLAGTFASKPTTRVVIVNERDFAGALAGGVLARANLGPVLLSGAGGLSAANRAELARLGPVGAYVIGNTASLSDQVVADLAASGIAQDQIIRIAGANNADTAAQIALAMDRRSDEERAQGVRAMDGAVIVNPASPDAAAVSVLAANRRLPVLFASGDTIPSSTAGALAALNIPNTIVVGRNRWIGDAVLPSLPRAHRLGGNDAVATSRVLIAESRRRGLPTNIVYSARASRRMDAALLGFAAGRMTGILLLTQRGETQVPALLNQLRIRGSVDRVIAVDGLARRRGR
jgi:hypothetical protein